MTAGGTPALRNPSAAYEVDDFQLVAFSEIRDGPLVARDNISVHFHGNAVLLHSQMFDQLGQICGGEVLWLAVDCELHVK